MIPRRFTLVCILLLVLLLPTVAMAQGTGTLTGRVAQEDGKAIGGVIVVISGLDKAEIADSQGRYRFAGVPPGTYTLTFTMDDNTDLEEGVTIRAGETTNLENTVDWRLTIAETVVVVSVSRRVERIVDAPAAISVVSELEIERDAPTGQLPKLLEFTPGVEMTQGGLYDFNVNTRGFNSSLTRRVAVLIDGRNPAVPFLASQEWGAASLPLDDIQSLEMLRGPSAALYGANASSGIINMVTRAPRGSEGGLFRLTGGELSTGNADFRWATELAGGWFLKLLGGYRSGDTFSLSRTNGTEYAGLPPEVIPLGVNEIDGYAANVRLDKYVGDSLALTFEGGNASVDGIVIQTNVGRVHITDVDRPWYRFNANHPRWNLLLTRTVRDAPSQTALGTGLNFLLDSTRDQAEVQGNWELGENARLVVGGSFTEEEVDTFDANRGVQTLLFGPVTTETTGVFGQVDWSLSKSLKLVLAGRYDDSDTFFDNEFSPKAALVWGVTPRSTLRFTYNQGFQAPAIFELFLQVDAGLPLQLQAFEGFCSPFGVSCGFDDAFGTRVLGLGNSDLGIEQIEAFEVGYSGILGGKAFLTVDYYNTRDEDFISDLISAQFTPLGDFNTVFGPYAPPAGLPADAASTLLASLQGALGPSFLLLSNNFDGTPILAAASYASFGEIDTQGVDVGINYYVDRNWTVAFNYSWFDFDVKQNVPGLENFLAPNSPENAVRANLAYVGEKFDFSFGGRWVDDFFWATGPFVGTVNSFSTFDGSAAYQLTDQIKLAVNVSNAFDESHNETFGGDLIGRRVLGSIEFRW